MMNPCTCAPSAPVQKRDSVKPTKFGDDRINASLSCVIAAPCELPVGCVVIDQISAGFVSVDHS